MINKFQAIVSTAEESLSTTLRWNTGQISHTLAQCVLENPVHNFYNAASRQGIVSAILKVFGITWPKESCIPC